MKMNLPNRLTLMRAALAPFFVFFMLYPVFGEDYIFISRIISGVIFIAAAITDTLDGHIARKRGIVTSFGKFLDPLADKFMVFAALFAIAFSDFLKEPFNEIQKNVFIWMSLIIVFRELAVTSLRLVVSNGSGVVIAANKWGKLKTISQLVCISAIILEPIVIPYNFTECWISFACMIVTTFFTVYSGFVYIKGYWKMINSDR